MRKTFTIIVCLAITLILMSLSPIISLNISNATNSEFPIDRPFLYIDPKNITANVGDEVTFSVKIFNLTDKMAPDPDNPAAQRPLGNLYGLDLKVKWDPSVLECINRTITVPVENYPKGVLHTPVLMVKNILNNTEGSYRLSCSSQYPAPPFNNPGQSSTIVILTFKVKSEGSTLIELVPVDPASTPQQPAKLSDNQGYRILYAYRGALFEIVGGLKPSFTVWPADGYVVVNEIAIFNASESQAGPRNLVVGYRWDFGDGNVTDWLDSPNAYHKYARTGVYYVKLQIKDDSGRTSSWTEAKKITVVNKRGVSVLLITFLSPRAVFGDILTFNVTVKNEGEAPENFTVSTYYNSTADGGWIYIGSKDVTVSAGTTISVVFYWNTSLLPRENVYYKVLANLTTVPYEHDIANNQKVSDPVELLTELFHDIKILSVSGKACMGGLEFVPPAILGENVRITFTVKAMGTYDETFNATLRIFLSNGTLWKTQDWKNEVLSRFSTKSFEFAAPASIVDNLNITIRIVLADDKYPADNFASYNIGIIAPPVLRISYSPKTIYTDEEVTFDATASSHPGGFIGSYTWDRKRAAEGVEKYRDMKKGPTATYKFETPGNWTVRLRVTDNWGITYDPTRPATAAYQLEIQIQVLTPPGPPYHIYALAIVVIAIVAIVLWRRKTKK